MRKFSLRGMEIQRPWPVGKSYIHPDHYLPLSRLDTSRKLHMRTSLSTKTPTLTPPAAALQCYVYIIVGTSYYVYHEPVLQAVKLE